MTKSTSWTSRLVAAATADALERGLEASALWSVLLGVAARRAAARSPRDVQRQYDTDRFVARSAVDQRALRRMELALLEAAVAYETVELSPLAPLGTCVAVAPGSQDRIVSTMRGTEVVSDPTNVMALECARRLRADRHATVRLATTQRCVRAQAVPSGQGFAAHFNLFCLATAAHETANQSVTSDAMTDHILRHLEGLAELERLGYGGYGFASRTVRLLASPAREHLAERIAMQVRTQHPGLDIERQPLNSAYYDGLRFMIDVDGADGGPVPLIDGGAFDWVARLAHNRKLRFVASAMGTQLAMVRFGTRADAGS